MKIKTGIGQDSHRFENQKGKPLMLGGIKFTHTFGLKGNSDADVVFHSITNSISSITGKISWVMSQINLHKMDIKTAANI